METNQLNLFPRIQLPYEFCKFCNSSNIKRDGFTNNKKNNKQRWKCLCCGKISVDSRYRIDDDNDDDNYEDLIPLSDNLK